MFTICENAFSIKVRIVPTYQNPIRFHQVFHGCALSQKLWIRQNLKIKLHVPIFEIYRLLCTHKQAHMKSKLNIDTTELKVANHWDHQCDHFFFVFNGNLRVLFTLSTAIHVLDYI